MAVQQLYVPKERPSDLAGLSKYTGELRKGLEAGRAKVKEREHEAKMIVAKGEMDKEMKDKEFSQKSLLNYWVKYDAKEGDRKIFDTSESGKEFHKMMKKHQPSAYDEQGNPIPVFGEAVKWVPKNRQEQLDFQRASEEMSVKIKSGAPLSAKDAVTLMQTAAMGQLSGTITPEDASAMTTYAQEILEKFKGGKFSKDLGNVDSFLEEFK